jgi:hypothetical protein
LLASGNLVGFIPTKDYLAARAFYQGKLGFEFVNLDQFALVVSVGGHKIRITKIPDFTPLQGAFLGWAVEDIQAAATWLRDRGVPPEKFPSHKTKSSESGPPLRRQNRLVQRP